MRSRILGTTLTLVVGAALGATAPTAAARQASLPTQVNRCWSSDNGRVVLDSVDVAPTSVDVSAGPATVSVTVHAHDTGGPGPATGIQRATATAAGVVPTELTRVDGDTWQATLVIPQGVPASTSPVHVSLPDGAGHETRDQSRELTVVDSDPDTTPPDISDLSMSATHVTTTRHAATVRFSAQVTDPSGVAAVSLDYEGIHLAGLPDSQALHRQAGTDTWSTTLRVPRWMGDRKLQFFLRASDAAAGGSGTQAFPSPLRITSTRDTRSPHLVKVLRKPRVIDIRQHGQWTRVRVALADDHGIAGASAGLRHPFPDTTNPRHDTRFGALHRVAGSRRHGVWSGRFRTSFCAGEPSRLTLGVTMMDVAGNHARARIGAVRLRARDHAAVFVRGRSRDLAAGSARWVFDEPVHGISAEQAQVYEYDGQIHEQIVGTWHCRDGTGHTASCLTGSVREVTFVQTQGSPVTPRRMLAVWQPEHHLDVLDRNGNPTWTNSNHG